MFITIQLDKQPWVKWITGTSEVKDGDDDSSDDDSDKNGISLSPNEKKGMVNQ